MAKNQNVSKSTVSNIWRSHNLKPHRVKSFKLSRDARFLQKLTDVVGLYLNPPQQALVLCVDEKSQDSGFGSNAAGPAAQKRPLRHYDSRLQTKIGNWTCGIAKSLPHSGMKITPSFCLQTDENRLISLPFLSTSTPEGSGVLMLHCFPECRTISQWHPCREVHEPTANTRRTNVA